MNLIILFLGKTISFVSKKLNLGNGSTWPGHIALKLNPNFIKDNLKHSDTKIILVTGTNGKTTTAKLIETILKYKNYKVFRNSSGANMLNGVASSIISAKGGKFNYDFAIFEIDENVVPLIVNFLEPDFIVALNLFRDQLDRYGELDTIAKKWNDTYEKMEHTKFILNADDPQIAFLGETYKNNKYFFGINDVNLEHKNHQHASDSILCPRCGKKLQFRSYFFSHLGIWECKSCGLKRPNPTLDKLNSYPLSGTYGIYDALAAALFAKLIGVSTKDIDNSLRDFRPAFGRQEKIKVEDKTVQFFLSKNPTSFNESLKTISDNGAQNLLIVLNDRIPDGTDVSWIWDIDFEELLNEKIKLYIAGDRVYDLALRLQYSGFNIKENEVFENLTAAITKGLNETAKGNIFYILPTYSAMLQTRKIITGKKIL